MAKKKNGERQRWDGTKKGTPRDRRGGEGEGGGNRTERKGGEMASEMASDEEGEGTTTVRRIASIRGTNETPCLAYLTLRS